MQYLFNQYQRNIQIVLADIKFDILYPFECQAEKAFYNDLRQQCFLWKLSKGSTCRTHESKQVGQMLLNVTSLLHSCFLEVIYASASVGQIKQAIKVCIFNQNQLALQYRSRSIDLTTQLSDMFQEMT